MIVLMRFILFVSIVVGGSAWSAGPFYFSDCGAGSDGACVAGSDSNNGLSVSSPKRSMAELLRMVRACTPAANDTFLLAAGGTLTQATAIVTFDASTNQVAWTAHGLSNDQRVSFLSNVYNSDGSNLLPAPLGNGGAYFVNVIDVDHFTLSFSQGGGVIDITGTTTAGAPYYGVVSGVLETAPPGSGTEYSGHCTIGKYTPAWGPGTAKPIILAAQASMLPLIEINQGGTPTHPIGGLIFQDIDFRGGARTNTGITLTSGAPGSVAWTAHGLTPGVWFMFRDTTGTLPAYTTPAGDSGQIVINRGYNVQSVIDADHFTIATVPTGNVLNRMSFTTAGTGTHTGKTYGYVGIRAAGGAQDIAWRRVKVSGFQAPYSTSDNPTYAGKVKNLQITDSEITDGPSICLGLFGGIRFLIENNDLSYCGDDSNRDHTMYVSGSDAGPSNPAWGTIIRGNRITHPSIGADGTCKAVIINGHASSNDMLIENNVITLTQAEQGPGCYGISIHPANLDPSIEFVSRLTMRANRLTNVGNIAMEFGACTNCLAENNEATWEAQTTGTVATLIYLHNASAFAQPNPTRIGTTSGFVGRNNSGYVDSCQTGGDCAMVRVDNELGGNVLVNNSMFYGTGAGTGVKYAIWLPPPATVTFSPSPGQPVAIAWANNSAMQGGQVVLSTTGSLPGPLVAGQLYYVISTGLSPNSIQVSATPGGSTVLYTSGAGTGTHTASVVPAHLIALADKNAAFNITSWSNAGYAGLDGGAITADPLLVAPGTGSFAIQSGSPLRNSGNSAYGATRDSRYRLRVGVPDIGSFEYGANASTVPPGTATNFH